MPFGTRMWSAGKFVMLVGALIATYVLFAAASMRIALRAREVTIPDLTNRTANDATALVSDLGLTLRVDETRRPDPKIAAGRVLAQEPAAGSIARRQRSVRIWLSAGQRSATVPKLVGETERTAQLRLAQDGLTLTGIAEIRSPSFAQDVVIAQMPPAKSAAGNVSLLVNRGDRGASYVMPDLIGVNGDRAAEILRARGFRVAVVGSNPYPGVAAGVVIRQGPQAGFQIGPGEPISLEVSR
ncbi:MAG TPA: PASTA domain-containing protein [Vicinamibacterales bacterium]|jgi:serine/threonine-protein kinase|nr:PASTA domain-containing protein [Vicinamibacterales bacterium]